MKYHHDNNVCERFAAYAIPGERDAVFEAWMQRIRASVRRAKHPLQATVTFLDPLPYDEIHMWTCDRCGGHVPTTVYGRKICGFCSGEGRERSWVKPEVQKKRLEERIETFLDD